jgi:hypothetical protein
MKRNRRLVQGTEGDRHLRLRLRSQFPGLLICFLPSAFCFSERQKGRKQKAESTKQKAESRKQKAQSRRQKAQSRKHKAQSTEEEDNSRDGYHM